MPSEIIDISQELFSCEVYPGDTAPTFTRVRSMPQDQFNLTDITMCAHNGTHADAPVHFIENGEDIASVPLEAFYGECIVADFTGDITSDNIMPYTKYRRILLRGNCAVTASAAKALAASGVLIVGIEGQSVGDANAPKEVHEILLGARVIPLEGLRLGHVAAGEYTLCAFPLKLSGSDGSPVRAVLIKHATT